MRLIVEDEGLLEGLSRQLSDSSERVIAFVGAGTSRAEPSLIPTWAEFFVQLCGECSALGQDVVARQCAEIAKLTKFAPAHLTACFDELQEAMGTTAYETCVRRILEPKGAGSPAALSALVRIPFTGVITTNLDELLEEACNDAARTLERPMLSTTKASNTGRGAGELAMSKGWLWKIHGTIAEADSWILTTPQYARSIYANETYAEALKTVVQSARLVFVGFGGADPDIERILKLLADRFGGRKAPHLLLCRRRQDFDLRRLANLNVRALEYAGPEDHSALPSLLRRLPRFPVGQRLPGEGDDSLYRSLLARDTGYIFIKGIGGGGATQARLPILDVYTSLHVLRGPANWEVTDASGRGGQRIELLKVIETNRRVVIMGDPGAGKTTFLRYVARHYLDDPSKPLPFYFSLADVQKFASRKKAPLSYESLIAYLADVSEREGWGLRQHDLRTRLSAGHCALLMDSLDLVSPLEERKKMLAVIAAASEQWDQCRFVMVTRPRALRDTAVPAGFDVVAIDQLRKPEVIAFVNAWTNLLYADAPAAARREHGERLLSAIRDSQDLRELARNPVMLTSIAVVDYNGKCLPDARADLLEAVIDWLLHARETDRNARELSRIRDLLYPQLALRMMEAAGGPIDQIHKTEAAELVASQFGGRQGDSLAFLTEEENETGILVPRDENVAFWHMWFQEYLAAREIASRTDDERTGWWAALQPRLDEVGWREVIAFVPACLNRLGRHRVDLFFERLAESCARTELLVKARRAGLGGGIIEDLRNTGYTADRVPQWTGLLDAVLPIFQEDGSDLPLQDRFDAAVAFGQGGDSRLRNFEDTWVTVEATSFLMGSQAQDPSHPCFDPDAATWEGPVVQAVAGPFEIRRYPITVMEFERFLVEGGYSREELWREGWEWRVANAIESPQEWLEQIRTPNCPVTGVSWFEACAYCNWRTSSELIRDVEYRLPTEAEWEYVARRGSAPAGPFPWGSTVTRGDAAEANWAWSGLRRKTPVGMFPRSSTIDGIADLFGNVEEWCSDRWTNDHANYPHGAIEATDLTPNPRRVVRGGSAIRFARLCRPTYRSRIRANSRYLVVGFRAVRTRIGTAS